MMMLEVGGSDLSFVAKPLADAKDGTTSTTLLPTNSRRLKREEPDKSEAP